MPIDRTQLYGNLGQGVGGIITLIAQLLQQKRQTEEYEGAMQNAPRTPRQFDTGGLPNQGMIEMGGQGIQGDQNAQRLPVSGGGIDWSKLAPILAQMAARGNMPAQRGLDIQLKTAPKGVMASPGAQPGTEDQFTGEFKPSGARIPDRPSMYGGMGQPTQLAKHQQELERIRTANPNDPRIPEYEAVIKKLQIGTPSFRFVQGPGGEYIPVDAKEGTVGAGSGQYSETPETVNMQIRSLADIGDSISNINKVVSRGSTGPVAGRVRKIGTKFFSDADQQALINYVGQLRPIIYGLSGKQINEAEQKWLDEEILPRIQQPDENFAVTVDIFNGWVKRKLQSMKEQYPGAIVPSSGKPFLGGAGKKSVDELNKLSDEELDAYLKSLEGKKK